MASGSTNPQGQTGSRSTAVADEAKQPQDGLRFRRLYSEPGADPFDAVEWEIRDALIANEKGETVFEQKGVEVPRFWSQTATNVVVSKYFRGHA